MKYYDFKKAREIIEQNKSNLETAHLGMSEDWFWTAVNIWSNGKYILEIAGENFKERIDQYKAELRHPDRKRSTFDIQKDYKDICIAGIAGSNWATPVIELIFKDGGTQTIDCYIGENDITPEEVAEKKAIWSSGPLSGPVQEERDKK